MIRALILIVLFNAPLVAQSFMEHLAAPFFYELGVEPGFQNNPLNLSAVEIEKAAHDADYLDGIQHSSSNTLSLYGKLNYAPRIFAGRKTRINLLVFSHHYFDIQERSYQSLSLSIKQSLGQYRYLELGYGILPELYLRNYLYTDPASQISSRQPCRFGSERMWLGFEHRLNKKNRLSYRLTQRSEIYQAPFAAYDMAMLEAEVALNTSKIKRVPLEISLQYGHSDNNNDIDTKDRSYRYLNFRPSLSTKLSRSMSLVLDGRYDQRAYQSEANGDPLHAGRYQDEIRLDVRLRTGYGDQVVIEPFVGYRERRVDSSDPDVANLKSFSRYWFGVRFGFKSVIDMYL